MIEDNWVQAARRALWLDVDTSLAKADRLGFVRRCVSREEKLRIVAECQQPEDCLTTIACRNRVALDRPRLWVCLAGGVGVAKLEPEDPAAQPPFVPVLVDDLPTDRVVTIEADGVFVRLPVDRPAMRFAAVAAYLERLAKAFLA